MVGFALGLPTVARRNWQTFHEDLQALAARCTEHEAAIKDKNVLFLSTGFERKHTSFSKLFEKLTKLEGSKWTFGTTDAKKSPLDFHLHHLSDVSKLVRHLRVTSSKTLQGGKHLKVRA